MIIRALYTIKMMPSHISKHKVTIMITSHFGSKLQCLILVGCSDGEYFKLLTTLISFDMGKI